VIAYRPALHVPDPRVYSASRFDQQPLAFEEERNRKVEEVAMANCMRYPHVIPLVLVLLAISPRADAQEIVSAEAILSGRTAAAAGNSDRPVEYSVDLGTSFSSIREVTFSFIFSERNPLDPEECLVISGDYPGASGFCEVFPISQTERILTFPCSSSPDVCSAYLDGNDAGLISAFGEKHNRAGRPIGRTAVTIESFTVLIDGVR
jgi:hypothetical protein